jgi:hypothetical protein
MADRSSGYPLYERALLAALLVAWSEHLTRFISRLEEDFHGVPMTQMAEWFRFGTKMTLSKSQSDSPSRLTQILSFSFSHPFRKEWSLHPLETPLQRLRLGSNSLNPLPQLPELSLRSITHER